MYWTKKCKSKILCHIDRYIKKYSTIDLINNNIHNYLIITTIRVPKIYCLHLICAYMQYAL